MFELDKDEVIKVLTRNAVKCLVCNTVLESKHRHHYNQCQCRNECVTDGGLVYQRVLAKDLDLVENLCEYVEMTRGERDKQLEQQKLDEQVKLQKRIDNGEMINVGNESNPHWVSKEVWDIVMKVSEKYYPNPKKKEK
jgi:hypothetical protein